MIPLKFYDLFAMPILWGWAEAMAPHGDLATALATVLSGTIGVSVISLIKNYSMAKVAVRAEQDRAELAVEAERRKIDVKDLNDRIAGQDKYIRDLEDKLRDVVREAERWKTLYTQTQPSSPKASEPR